SYLPRRLLSSAPAPAGIPDMRGYHTRFRPLPRPASRPARSGKLWSELHNFFLFGLRDLFDLPDVLVGQLLDLGLALLALVLGDLLFLFGVFDHVHRIATRRAHRHAGFLGLLADDLRELLAALL